MQRSLATRSSAVLLSLGLVALGVTWSGRARADVSSWVSTAAGPALAVEGDEVELYPSLELAAGLGTPAKRALIVGGGFRLGALFGFGTDLGAALRVASRGYARGGWGVAVDLGGYHRFAHVSDGGVGTLTLGAPWGLLLAGSGSLGTEGTTTVGLLLGLDFARLTAHRTTGQRWWPNPLAAPQARGSGRAQWASAMSLR